MPRFYFHTNHPAPRSLQDDEGISLRSIREAKGQAVATYGHSPSKKSDKSVPKTSHADGCRTQT
jgi:hypothetical protein